MASPQRLLMVDDVERTEPVLAGVPLLQYAAVRAALDEEFELAEVLEIEGLDVPTWDEAHDLFGQDIGTSPACFMQYQSRLAEAQDRLRRPVVPIDEDVEAWVAFLGAWRRHADSPAMLLEHGLRTSDLARLERAWYAKIS